jgi:hypothetical protein
MAVRAITVYEASDGKKFDTQEKAHAYEFASTRINNFRRILANPNIIRAPEGLAVDLFNSPAILEELRDACNKGLDYHRRYGKLKGVTPAK